MTGTDFVTGAQVTFSGTGITVNSTTFNSPSSLTVDVTIAADAPPSARDLTISDGDGGTASGIGVFTVTPGPSVEPPSSLPSGPPSSSAPPLVEVRGANPTAGLTPVTASISPTSSEPTVLTTTAITSTQTVGSAPTAMFTVSVPAAAIPGAASLVLQSVASVEDLLALAPMPASEGELLLAVSVRAFDATGLPISGEFAAPVLLTVTIPPASVPANASPADFIMVFWSGAAWLPISSEVTFAPDGSVVVRALITHFTLYGVRYQSMSGSPSTAAFAPAQPVFGDLRIALAVFLGRTTAELEVAALAAGASGVWCQDRDGIYRLLIVGGPSFITDQFSAAFPTGFSGATAVTLVQ